MANFDDCFYAEKAKEILQNHDWWVLTFNHHPAFENPPFYMWLMALAYKVFGVSEFSAKLPSALMGVSTVVLLYFMGRVLFNTWVGLFGAFVLATTYPFMKFGRHAMVDVTLTFLVTAALFFFWLATHKDSRFFLAWGLFLGLALLDKSLLGFSALVIPLAYLFLGSHGEKGANLYLPLGLLLGLGLGCSWYGVEYLHFGNEFLSAHFGWLILHRGFQTGPEPWYYHFSFLRDLATFYWPWFPLALLGFFFSVMAKFWEHENLFLVVLWAALPTLGVSLTHTRPLWYFMPIFPALAFFAAYALDHLLAEPTKAALGKTFLSLGVLAALLVNFLPISLDSEREHDVRTLAPTVKAYAERGASILGLREEYYSLNNAMLFYSDHAIEPLFDKVENVAESFRQNRLVLCFAHQGDMAEIRSKVREWYPVTQAGDYVLIANRAEGGQR
ncbi:MAG TPA: glycosyltransferase family 39 protein [bacterium]|nr:glycosyltransferase family 39 protein [bacterium]